MVPDDPGPTVAPHVLASIDWSLVCLETLQKDQVALKGGANSGHIHMSSLAQIHNFRRGRTIFEPERVIERALLWSKV